MKLVGVLVVLFVIVNLKGADSQKSPTEALCDCLDDELVDRIGALATHLRTLIKDLDDLVNAALPGLNFRQRFTLVAIRKALKINLNFLLGSAAFAARIDTMEEKCKLTKILKTILISLTKKIAITRRVLRLFERTWVKLFPGGYLFSPIKNVINQIMDTFQDISERVLETTKCYMDIFDELHCVNGDQKASLGEEPKEEKSLEDAKEGLEECVCDKLETELKGNELPRLLADFALLAPMVPGIPPRLAAQAVLNALRNDINNGLLAKPEDDVCALMAWAKTLIWDLHQKIYALRGTLRFLELTILLNNLQGYERSPHKRLMDRLMNRLDTMEGLLIKVGLCYLDFFLDVHCNPEKCTCIIEGDPMVRTCDKDLILLQGQGFFQMIEVLQTMGGCNDIFEVFLHVMKVDDRPVPVGIVLKLGNVIISITDSQLEVNGAVQTLPYSSGSINVESQGPFTVLTVNNCAMIAFKTGRVNAMVTSDLMGKLRGLCGNFNGVSEISITDDMHLISNIFARTSAQVFGEP